MLGFLPNFCANASIFVTVLLGELFALVLVISDSSAPEQFWHRLALISLFVQWVVLGSAALLCLSRAWLARLQAFATTVAVLAVTLSVTLSFSWLSSRVFHFSAELPSNTLLFIMRNLVIASIITLIALRYFYIHHQWQCQIEAEAQARLQALQARIHPHFLFNTLNTITSLIAKQPEQAEQAVLDLADLLRAVLSERTRITLAEELELTRRYLAIEQLRMGERLRIDWQLAEDLPLEQHLPPLILQPLVENALRHGLQQLASGGTLTLRIERQADLLHFTVTNPCPPAPAASGHCIAQENIRQRLALAYPVTSQLHTAQDAGSYQVAFSIPVLPGTMRCAS